MHHHADQTPEAAISAVAPQIREGIGQLLRAFAYSRDLECSVWDFSVEIERLLAQGLTTSDLRWLVKRGYLSHAQEITTPSDSNRRFDTGCRNLAFSSNSCFVVTDSGVATFGSCAAPKDRPAADLITPSSEEETFDRASEAFVNMAESGEVPYSARQMEHVSTVVPSLRLRYAASIDAGAGPSWDRETRTFMVGEYLVKRFRVPSPNQEAVLDAFQEEGWPRSVDDPLSPVPEQQPKRRLRDTIKCLNMNQANRAIRFRGDGTGQRVSWEVLIDSAGNLVCGQAMTIRRAA
jgi:hypothetical protein